MAGREHHRQTTRLHCTLWWAHTYTKTPVIIGQFTPNRIFPLSPNYPSQVVESNFVSQGFEMSCTKKNSLKEHLAGFLSLFVLSLCSKVASRTAWSVWTMPSTYCGATRWDRQRVWPAVTETCTASSGPHTRTTAPWVLWAADMERGCYRLTDTPSW